LGALVGAYIHIQLSVIVNEINEHILQIFHVITSRELTSGFDFWSRGHRCMAVTRLPMKFGGDIFIQCGIIDIFFKIKDPPSWICLDEPWDHPRNLICGAYNL